MKFLEEEKRCFWIFWFMILTHFSQREMFIYLSVTVFTINVCFVLFFTLSEAVPSIIVTVILSIYQSSICSEEYVTKQAVTRNKRTLIFSKTL